MTDILIFKDYKDISLSLNILVFLPFFAFVGVLANKLSAACFFAVVTSKDNPNSNNIVGHVINNS